MIHSLKLSLAVLVFTLLFGCKEDKQLPVQSDEINISTFYFIRHAEKDRSNPDDIDPELNQDGLGRAIRWAEVFDYVPLDVIYTTDFERTEMTAAPTAVKKDLILQYYKLDELNMDDFKATNLGKQVLVVGHSNTIPKFVNKMLGTEQYNNMDDYDNSSLFIVRIINGKATDIRLKMD